MSKLVTAKYNDYRMKKNMTELMAKMTQMGKSSQAYKLKTSSLEVSFTGKDKQVY